MLNGRVTLLQILLILFVVSPAFGQNVEVLKAELKGVEGRLDAKIDGAKNELNAKIDGVKGELNASIDGAKGGINTSINGAKDELNASIDGVKSVVNIILWIIGGIGAVFTIFLGFLGYLLNYFVKQLLPSMIEQNNQGRTREGQQREEFQSVEAPRPSPKFAGEEA